MCDTSGNMKRKSGTIENFFTRMKNSKTSDNSKAGGTVSKSK